MNTTVANSQQTYPEAPKSVAADSDGNFVVTWSSFAQDGDGAGETNIYAQRFDASGNRLGSEFLVNNQTSGSQRRSVIAMDDDGDFVVVWESDGNQDGSGLGVFARRYNSEGVAQGAQFQVNSHTNGDQYLADVTMDDDGNFVVTWTSDGQDGSGGGVYAKRFAADGSVLGGEFRVNSTTAADQRWSSAAMDDAGNFVITWSSQGQDGDSWGIIGQRYNAAGVAQGGEIQVNTTTANGQHYSSVAMDATGNFVVSWSTSVGADAGIRARRFDSSGTGLGNEFQVNTYTLGDQIYSSIAIDEAGTFLITWTSIAEDGSGWGIYARQFASDGSAMTGGMRVNTTTSNNQWYSSVATGGGQFVITWSGEGSGDGQGVFYQRYDDGINSAPINRVPGGQTLSEDGILVFSTANGNRISVSDADAGGSPVEVTLSVTNGTLSLSGTAGLSFSTGDGANDSTMVFSGTITAINAALDGMAFVPRAEFNGASQLTITTNDQGNSGTGTPLSDTDTVALTINAVNDAPSVLLPGNQAINEDSSLTFALANGNQVSISDVDAGGGLVQVNLSLTSGALSLSGTTGLVFSIGDGTGDLQMEFTGTVADINSALQGMTVAPGANFNGSITLTVSVNDQGNSGPGGNASDSDTVVVDVLPVNDAPVNSVPGAQAVDEDTPLVFSGANGNQISVSDLDAGANQVQVTLTVSNGALSLSGTAGLTFSSGSGTADSTMVFTGTVAAVNTALDGLRFDPTANFQGSAVLQITTNDQGNTGAGGAQSANDSVNITVASINDAPTHTVPGPQTTNEDIPLVFSAANGNQVSLVDVDAASGSVEVTLSVTNGQLTLNGIAGLSFTTGSGSGDTTMTFSGTVASINAALNGLTYTPDSEFSGAASLQVSSNDQGNTGAGGPLTAASAIAISVNSLNDAPTYNEPGDQITPEDVPLVFSIANGNSISVADIDAGAGLLEVTLTAAQGLLTLGDTNGLSFSMGTGFGDATIVFTASLADINAALDGLTFTPVAGYNGPASLQLSTSDQGNTGGGGPQTTAATVNIQVTAVNDSPANSVPGPQSTDEDTPLTFSPLHGNAISITDPDAAPGPLAVMLSVTNGTLSLSGTTGLTFIVGDGTSDSLLTFEGQQADINAALNGLQFTPTANFNGAAVLQIVTDDQGNTGAGGALTESSTVTIAVNAINDAPTHSLPGPQSVNEDTPLVFSSVNGNAIVVSDVDAGSNSLQVALTITNGTLSLSQTAGLSFSVGTGANDSTLVFNGTAAAINAALEGMIFEPASEFGGVATLGITTDDGGSSGAGGALSASNSLAITVNQINDAPALTIPGNQDGDVEETVFSPGLGNGIVIADIDAGGNPVQVTLTATNGTLSLNGSAGLTFLSGGPVNVAEMVFSGTVADINAALDGLTFHYGSGAGNLRVVVNDQGNTGAGGSQSASAEISLSQVPLIWQPPNSSSNDNSETEAAAERLGPAPRIQTIQSDPTTRQRESLTELLRNRSSSRSQSASAGMVPSQELPKAELASNAEEFSTGNAAGISGIQPSPGTPVVRRPSVVDMNYLWNQMEALSEDLRSALAPEAFFVGTVATFTAVLSAGYIIWILRGGALLASALSALPAWKSFDPLPVLEFWERNSEKHDERDADDDDEESPESAGNETRDDQLHALMN